MLKYILYFHTKKFLIKLFQFFKKFYSILIKLFFIFYNLKFISIFLSKIEISINYLILFQYFKKHYD